jgi:hypothetical protein
MAARENMMPHNQEGCYQWDNIQKLFQGISSHTRYLILRNYEDIEFGNLLLEGHNDVDILCDDVKTLVESMRAFPRYKKDNGRSYFCNLQGQYVKLDIKHIGDGYYDQNWQEVMLKNRVMHHLGFYIADKENYYYSLAYHGLLQKPVLADEYRKRLIKISADIGFVAYTKRELIERLNIFMRMHGYKYTDPTGHPTMFINFAGLPKDLIQKNYPWRIRRFFRDMKQKSKLLVKKIFLR